MKFIKSPNGALTLLLIILIVVSCFWIVKSEIRTASLLSRLDEHHEQLKNNSDELDNLNTFIVSIVLDANYHKELYAIIGEFSDIELTVDPSNLLINEIKVRKLSEKPVGEIISTSPTIRKRRVRNRAKGVIV